MNHTCVIFTRAIVAVSHKDYQANCKKRIVILKSIVPTSENVVLAKAINATTSIVGISIHLLSKGFLSATNKSTAQEKITTDARPIGYTISVTPILSGIHTNIATPKSAIAAIQ